MTAPETGKDAVEGWSVEQVAAWLEGLQLTAVAPQFRVNAVDGSDLLGLSSDDLQHELGCTPLQARKIRNSLAKLTGDATPAGSNACLQPQGAAAATPSPTPPAVGTPPVAVGVPVGQVGPAAPTIAATDLSRYKMLSMTIDELERIKAPEMLAQAQRSEQYLAEVLATDSRALTKMEAAVTEEEGKLDKLEHNFSLGKVLLGNKHHEAKLAEHRATLAKLTAQRDAQRARLEEGNAKLGEANKVLAAWSAKVSDLGAAQRDRKALVERIFAAPEWAGREPLLSLSRAQAELQAQAQKAEGTAQIYARAKNLLKQAMAKLNGALQALGQTQMMGMMEMGMDIGRGPFMARPGDMMVDFVEMAAVEKANDLVRSAAQDISATREVLPTMPYVEEALLKAATLGIFQNVLFNNMFSDMAQMMMVRESMGQVEKMAGQAQQLLEWVGKNLTAFETQAATHRAGAEGKAAEARAYWQQQMDRALAIAGGSNGGSGGPTLI